MSKFLSRKLLVTLIADLFAVYAAFGGQLSEAQSGAIIALVSTVYIIVNGQVAKAKATSGS